MWAKRFLVAAAVAFSLGASAASAGVRDLTPTIEAEKGFLSAAEDVVVRFTLRNDSRTDLYVLQWQTPLQGVKEDIFEVRRDGEPVDYTGRLYKWAQPRPQDYIRIPAGQSVSADVELSSVYDMSRTGEYSIQYRVPVREALRASGRQVEKAGIQHIESNKLSLGVERVEPPVAESTDGDGLRGITAAYLAPSYVSCSSTRQSTLVTATSNAEAISLKARNYLSSVPTALRSTDPAYKTWFGTYTSSRYSTVQNHFNAIYSAFNTKRATYFCDCTDSAYAYVYSNRPYEIHLCNAFWNAPALGTDSKAGTLVHEMSHFSVVAGTRDYAYGQTACKNLAISNPTRATNNADNHEYFAETR
jgi:peptidyl-Lys metalloendopeptidase